MTPFASLMVAALLSLAQPEDAGLDAAQRFWKAMGAAEAEKLSDFYASRVVLKAGSELLKPEWQLVPAGRRDQDQSVERDALLKGYRRLFDKAGKDRWTSVFAKIRPDKIAILKAAKADEFLRGVRAGVVLLKVATGPGDDALIYVLRAGDDGRWRVTLEATDY